MRRLIAGAGLVALLAAALGAGADETVERAMSGWPERAKSAARETLARYGKPGEIGRGALVWRYNGPWKRTVVYRTAWPHDAGGEDRNYLENTIGYRVPAARVEELTAFDGKLDADARFGEMSARSDSEATNFLLLNVADEIARGERSAPDARRFAARILRLSAAGKSSPYLAGLLFRPHHDAPAAIWRAPVD